MTADSLLAVLAKTKVQVPDVSYFHILAAHFSEIIAEMI